jgi:hypothetical protein
MTKPVSLFRSRSSPWLVVGVLAGLMAWLPACRAVDLQGHRGARGLAPENTLAAFERALKIGVSTLELDVAITADGVAVVSHEPALFEAIARDAQGQWLSVRGPLIRSLTLAQVQAYDVGRLNPAHAYGRPFPEQAPRDGQRIPTLASVFALVKALGATDVQFNIETKVYPNRPDDTVTPEAFVEVLLATIRDAGMTRRVIVQSFDWRTLALVLAHRVPDHAGPQFQHPGRWQLDGRAAAGGLPLGGPPGQGSRLHHLVTRLHRPGRGRRPGRAGTGPAGDSVDRQQPGRPGPADRLGCGRDHHRLP